MGGVWEYSSKEDSDNEVNLGHASDEEKHPFLSVSRPKFQFRSVKSKARWNDEIGMAEVIEKKGKMWVTTGIVRSGKIYSSILETLYLMELGALQLLDTSNECIGLEDIYLKAAGLQDGFCLELFEVYRHLKPLGYIIGQHCLPWSLKGMESSHEPVGLEDTEENKQSEDADSKNEQSISELFGRMQINELRPDFDVYLPNNKFRKSAPGDPSFLVYLSRAYPPFRTEIEVLQRQCSGIPLKICRVDDGRVSFFSFDKVELPVLP